MTLELLAYDFEDEEFLKKHRESLRKAYPYSHPQCICTKCIQIRWNKKMRGS